MARSKTTQLIRGVSAGATAVLMTISVASAQPECSITCPINIIVANDPNQCGAVVNYPGPSTMGECGTVMCSPAAGSFFPVGTVAVTCTTQEGPSCIFNVTVSDTQIPTITCPGNVDVPTLTLPVIATFPPPTASDNCPGVTTGCVPPSGSSFDVGETIVTCMAMDASGNTASCTFSVRVLLQRAVPALTFIGLAALAILMAAIGTARRHRA